MYYHSQLFTSESLQMEAKTGVQCSVYYIFDLEGLSFDPTLLGVLSGESIPQLDAESLQERSIFRSIPSFLATHRSALPRVHQPLHRHQHSELHQRVVVGPISLLSPLPCLISRCTFTSMICPLGPLYRRSYRTMPRVESHSPARNGDKKSWSSPTETAFLSDTAESFPMTNS